MGPAEARARAARCSRWLFESAGGSSAQSGPTWWSGVGGYSSGPVVHGRVAAAACPPPCRSRTRCPASTNKHPRQVRAARSSSPSTRRKAASSPRRRRTSSATRFGRKLMDNYLPEPSGDATTSYRAWSFGGSQGAQGAQHPRARGARCTSTTLRTEPAVRPPDRQGRPGHGALGGLQAAGLSEPTWWSSSTTCSAAYAQGELVHLPRRSHHARRAHRLQEGRRSSCRFPTPPTTTRPSTPSALVEAGAALMFREAEPERRGARRRRSVRSKADPERCRRMEQAGRELGARGGAGAGRRLRADDW